MKRLPVASLLIAFGLAGAAPAWAQDAPAPAPQTGPANLCQELLAFVKQPAPATQAAATPPAQATAVSNPSGKSEGAPSSGAGEVQQKSGLSGPVTQSGPDQAHKSAVAQANAAAKSPAAPGASPPPPKPDATTISAIEAAAAANDQAQCRASARSMRVAGVIMPPPLLALAALDLKFFAR